MYQNDVQNKRDKKVISMSSEDNIIISLIMYNSMGFLAIVRPKNINYKRFIAEVGELDYSEENPKITFFRTELTSSFPGEKDDQNSNQFTMYTKDILDVDWLDYSNYSDPEKYLNDLIQKINGELDKEQIRKSEDTNSWKANREAEKLANKSLFPILQNLLKVEKIQGRREAAYVILGHLARNTQDSTIIEYIARNLIHEQDDQTVNQMLITIHQAGLLFSNHINDIIHLAESRNELIRQGALLCLGLDKNKTKSSIKVLLKILQNSENKYDLKYSIASIGKIGSKEIIGTLKSLAENNEKSDLIEEIKTCIQKINFPEI